MILREIKNIYIKNRLTEGVDFKRYEWLCTQVQGKASDGNGYAGQSIFIGNNPDSYEYTINYDNIPSSKSSYLFILSSVLSNKVIRVYYPNDVYLTYAGNSIDRIYHFGYNLTKPLNVYIDKTKIVINDITYSSQINSIYLELASNGRCPLNGKYSNIKVNGNAFFPCKLLQDIPAHLDSSGIARSANECGLIGADGKFYGKTSYSKGTFTVEGEVEPETHTGLQQIYQNRLIEGVDYETYDWLKADIPAGTSMMQLPINSKNFEFQRNFVQLMNSRYFNTSDSNKRYTYYITDVNGDVWARHPQIWDPARNNNTFQSSVNVGLGIHTIIANNDGVSISGNSNVASLPWYGNPTSIAFNNSNNQNIHTICLTSSIKVDGVTRYVPCQLLHSIPRNLDAQCKERVAGECGMIDLISGKFYGNVANSGTFTVENDSNE